MSYLELAKQAMSVSTNAVEPAPITAEVAFAPVVWTSRPSAKIRKPVSLLDASIQLTRICVLDAPVADHVVQLQRQALVLGQKLRLRETLCAQG